MFTHMHTHTGTCMHILEFGYLWWQKTSVPLELELQSAALRVLGILILCKSTKHSWLLALLSIPRNKNISRKVRQNSFPTHPPTEFECLLQESR